MKKIESIVIFLLIIGTVMPAFAEDLPLRPGDGFSRIEIFRLQHMNMEENQEIMSFINAYGISDYEIKNINDSYKFIYIIPNENYSKKLVFLERTGGNSENWKREIVWVRQIGMNETIPFEPPGPLDDLFAAHPSAKNNETIVSFIEDYAPEKWKETRINLNSSVVYLISGNVVFRELMFIERDGNIVQVEIFDESKVLVNRTEALEIAGNRINSSVQPQDVRVVFSDSNTLWSVTYMEGPAITTLYVDTGSGKLYYSMSEPTDIPKMPTPEILEFTGGLLLVGILGVLWILVLERRSKK